MGNLNFEQLYHRLIKGISEKPPSSVWENVEEELDLDDIWKDIDQKLPVSNPVETPTSWKQLFTTAALLLLLFIPENEVIRTTYISSFDEVSELYGLQDSSLLTFEQNSAPEEGQSDNLQQQAYALPNKKKNSIAGNYATEQSVTIKEEAQKLLAQEKDLEEKATMQNSSSLDEQQHSLATATDARTTQPAESTSLSTSNNRLNTSSPPFKTSLYNQLAVDEKEISYNYLVAMLQSLRSKSPGNNKIVVNHPDTLLGVAQPEIIQIAQDSNHSVLKFASIGLNAAIKNSWLLNNETRAAFKDDGLADAQLTLTKDIGVSVQWETQRNQKLQASYFFISENAQLYNQYIEARYTKKTLQLDYQKLAVEFIQPIKFTRSHLILGSYIGNIRSVEEIVGENSTNYTKDYQKWEYGVILGLQYEILLTKKISLQPAIRLQYGLNNIFKGDNLTPAGFNSTHPVNAGVGIGLYYNF